MNTNLFVRHNIIVNRIQIFEYFLHEYLNIVIEKYFNIPWNSARGNKNLVIRKTNVKLCYLPFQICIVEA